MNQLQYSSPFCCGSNNYGRRRRRRRFIRYTGINKKPFSLESNFTNILTKMSIKTKLANLDQKY